MTGFSSPSGRWRSVEQWRLEHNYHRPHSSLGYLPLAVFAEQARLSLPLV